jgi:hypothetical protein
MYELMVLIELGPNRTGLPSPLHPPRPEHMIRHDEVPSQCGAFQLCPSSWLNRPTRLLKLPLKRIWSTPYEELVQITPR